MTTSAQTTSTPSSTSAIARPQSPDMVYRQPGTTGEAVSAIGLGGFNIGKQMDPPKARGSFVRHRPSHHLHGQLLGL